MAPFTISPSFLPVSKVGAHRRRDLLHDRLGVRPEHGLRLCQPGPRGDAARQSRRRLDHVHPQQRDRRHPQDQRHRAQAQVLRGVLREAGRQQVCVCCLKISSPRKQLSNCVIIPGVERP